VSEKDATILRLERKVSELEERLNKNSKNSHMPPSNDSSKIKAANKRTKGGKRGGQQGHQGFTLDKFDEVDEVIVVEIPIKCSCGHRLKGVDTEVFETRQVVDIPVQKFIVTEYQRVSCVCPRCKKINMGSYAPEVAAPVQYGANIQSLSTLLNNEYKVPIGKISQFFEDIFGLRINESTICSINKRCYRLMADIEQQIISKILDSEVAHVDETGILVNAELLWMHVMSTKYFTYLRVHEKRGSDAFNEVITEFEGHLVHDFFKSYFCLEKSKHNTCGAHISRELEALIEDNSKWAGKLKALMLQLFHNSYNYNKRNKQEILSKYDSILKQGIKQEPKAQRIGKRGRESRSKGLNLIHRLQKYKTSVLEYAFNPIIPFTNNQAERDLRHCKIKLKVSGCFRSLQGAKFYARIISVISTLRKNSLNIFESLQHLFKKGQLELLLT
jgi:transposase